ncbi:hypothetical protein POJ06DRAFT_246753 [Lipomyces tetrasporus]|uniref:Transmembrane protein n=1 Tax=Lipomyces tetrasporus TaxID=54092 RepID=A0AAD7QX78_9ASCO|nr:uncharacterized protein POJ06DRAFT_246753 [Lipomyces tetrasporus]KAJ8103160.1 hypothetical protein POJ06DRAFT_246753 [Lipomyces tetrasporus]
MKPVIHGGLRLGIVLLAVSTLLLWTGEAEAKDPNGVKSQFFDPKYKPPEDTLVTPIGHPGLFAFAGRWHRFREVFKASVWPGTYLTVLSFGNHCTFVLKPRISEWTNLTYTVSVDDGPTFEVWKAIDVSDTKAGPVLLRINTTDTSSYVGDMTSGQSASSSELSREPHVVKIVSSRRTSPLSIQGFYIPTSVVRQDPTWVNYQKALPYVEFIGGPAHNEESFAMNSAEWTAAEGLHFRHNHITTDDCFSANCTSQVASLSQQYDRLNPVYRDVYYKPGLTHSGLFAFYESPLLQMNTPGYVIINVGDKDFEEKVPPMQFSDELYDFLKFVRIRAHPDAYIFVLLKKGRYFRETRDVVDHLRDLNIVAVPSPSTTDARGWTRFLQKHILPLTHTTSRFGNSMVTFRDAAISTSSAFAVVDSSTSVTAQLFVLFAIILGLAGLLFLRHGVRSVLLAVLTKAGIIHPATNGKRYKPGKSGNAWD